MKSCSFGQSGVVLVISLVLLFILTIIGIMGAQTTSLEEKMAGNMRDQSLAFQAAEAALKAGENYLSAQPFAPPINDCTTVGLYPTPLPVVGCEALDVLIPVAQNEAVWRDTFPLSVQHDVDGSDSTIDLVSINANPRYIIEDLGPPIVCPEYSAPAFVGQPFVGRPDCHTYRVTSRATGSSSTSVVMVESIFDYGNSVARNNDIAIAGGIVGPTIPPQVNGVRRSWRQIR